MYLEKIKIFSWKLNNNDFLCVELDLYDGKFNSTALYSFK